MTQDAVVTRVYKNGMAEVAVTRSTACGGNCGNCESCIFQSELKALARNAIGAKAGERVVIESSTKKVFGAALLVYIMPLILFLAGYAFGAVLGLNEPGCVLLSFAGLVLGGVLLVLSQKRGRNKKQIEFDIIRHI